MKKISKQSGQVLIGVAFAMVVLAGFAGLAIDMGTLRFQKRLQQSAADAAAIAGANNLNYTGAATSWLPAAQAASNQNGFADTSQSLSACTATATVGTTCVLINRPPADVTFNGNLISGGPHAGNNNYVETLVAKVQPTYFMKIFGYDSEVILARAVATNTSGGAGSGVSCITTLGTPTKQVNFNKAGVGSTGTVYLKAPTCGISDNGNFVANGTVSVKAAAIGVGGAVNLPNNSNPDCTQLQPDGVCPTPTTGMAYTGDPLANQYPGFSVTSAGTSSTSGTPPVTTFTPGTYSNLTLNTGTNYYFQNGVYQITGAFHINGGAFVCGGGTPNYTGVSSTFTCSHGSSDGVTFDVTGSGSITVNGSSTTQLYAPDSGTYEGLLFYQDPSDTQQATINGTDNSVFQGAIYMPTADLDFSGTANFNSGAAYTVIVVDQFLSSGTAYINLKSDFSGLANGGGPLTAVTTSATLVE